MVNLFQARTVWNLKFKIWIFEFGPDNYQDGSWNLRLVILVCLYFIFAAYCKLIYICRIKIIFDGYAGKKDYFNSNLFTVLLRCIFAGPWNIGKAKAFQVSGELSAAAGVYSFLSSDTSAIARGVPFSYTLTGSLNASVYSISVPLSFTYSNNQKSYRQPFNQFGISPYYKWAKLNVGYRSLVFSPYTLNSHTILGAGVELTPSHLRFRFDVWQVQLRNQWIGCRKKCYACICEEGRDFKDRIWGHKTEY